MFCNFGHFGIDAESQTVDQIGVNRFLDVFKLPFGQNSDEATVQVRGKLTPNRKRFTALDTGFMSS